MLNTFLNKPITPGSFPGAFEGWKKYQDHNRELIIRKELSCGDQWFGFCPFESNLVARYTTWINTVDPEKDPYGDEKDDLSTNISQFHLPPRRLIPPRNAGITLNLGK